MVRFEIFTIGRGGGRTPQTIEATSVVGSFATRAEAERFLREKRFEIASGDTPVGVRPVPTAAQAAVVPRTAGGLEIRGPPPSGRGRRLQRERLGRQAIEKAVRGEVISRAERDAARRLIGTNVQTIAETKRLQAIKKAPPKPPTRREFTTSLFKKLGFEVTPTARGVRAIKPGVEILTSPISVLTARGKRIEGALRFQPEFREKLVTPVKKIVFKPSISLKPRPKIVKPKPLTRLERFEERVEAQKKRQREFFESPGFQRIEALSSFITGGARIEESKLFVIPKEERGPVGRVAATVTEFFAGGPLVIGGTVALTFEKLKLTGEALTIPEISKRDIAREFFIGAPKRVITEFKELPPEEKIALGISVAIAPFLAGGPVRQFLGKRVTRAKAIEELTPIETAKLERFELSVSELKGVRVQPKQLNLQEVQRLSPKAAKAVDAVILKNKQNVVVGGSVAQRTQIKGKSRVPEDIDIFTSKEPKQLLRELETELKKQGVQRVSVVRNKQITIEGKKAIEVKNLALLQQNIAKVQLPFETFSSALVTTPRGVKVLRLGAQAQRKVVGGFGLERERIRFKDIQDLPDILRQLRKSRRATFIPRRPRPREPFAIPSILTKGLKGEPSFFISGGLGRPSGIGGVLPSRITPISISPFEISGLRPLRAEPSRLFGAPRDISKITGISFEPTPLSLLRPTPPSKLTPFREPPSRITPFKEPPPPPPGRRIILLPREKKPRLRQRPAFRTEVREGLTKADKFIRTKGVVLPRQKAINKGARIVDRTTAASFRIVRKGKTTLVDDGTFPLMNKFRARRGKTRLPPRTFVERSKFRIDSFGERAGIPFSPERLPALKRAFEIKKARKQRKRFIPPAPVPLPLVTGGGRTRKFL